MPLHSRTEIPAALPPWLFPHWAGLGIPAVHTLGNVSLSAARWPGGDFPGGPTVKTPSFQFRGYGFSPKWGN